MFTNLRSMKNKFYQLEAALICEKIDIAVLSETWVEDHQTNAYNVLNYRAFHRCRNRVDKIRGGGVAIYVRNSFSVQRVSYPHHDFVECLSIIVRPKYLPRDIPWLAFIALYIPPEHNNDYGIADFIISEIDMLMSINIKGKIFLMGDFNGYDIEFLRIRDFMIIFNGPTRGHNNLDICLSNCGISYFSKVLPPLANSDHKVVCLIPSQHNFRKNNTSEIYVRQTRKSNYRSMGIYLSRFDWNAFYLINDIEFASQFFHCLVTCFYELAFPLVKIKKRENDLPWINTKIRKMIDIRNNNYEFMDTENKKKSNSEIKIEMMQARRSFMDIAKSKFSVNSSNIHRRLKAMLGIDSGRANGCLPFQGKSIEESFENVCDFFGNLANIHGGVEPEEIVISDQEQSVPTVDEIMVMRELSQLKESSSSAPDDVPPIIYKEFAILLARPVTFLINLSLNNVKCPRVWKKSFLIVIPKTASPSSPDQLRPLSITSPVVKICERVIVRFLWKTVGINVEWNQFGGVPERSVTQYLAILLDAICRGLQSDEKKVLVMLTDFQKAFNNVDHKILLQKMFKMNIPSSICKWIISFLYKREQVLIDRNNGLTKSFEATCGIPQGSVMGSFLFVIMINGLNIENALNLKFIDDFTVTTTISRENSQQPQAIFDHLVSETNKLNLPLNVNKCGFMLLQFDRELIEIDIKGTDNKLKEFKDYKILGINIQNDLKWDIYIKEINKKVNSRMFIIYAMKRLGFSGEFITSIYKSYIRPCMEYCSPIWNKSLTICQTKELERMQYRIARIIIGDKCISGVVSCQLLNLEPLCERRDKQHLEFARKFVVLFHDLCQPLQGDVSGRSTRGENKYRLEKCKTFRMRNSPINSFMIAINEHL